MAIDVTAIDKYIDENKLPLIKKAVMGAQTNKWINVQTGIEGDATINVLSSTVVFGDSCEFTAAGTDKITQRKIETAKMNVNKSFCEDTLRKYFLGIETKQAAGSEKLPQEQVFIQANVDQVVKENEKLIWQGDTAGTGNISKYDGFLKLMGADTAVIDETGAGVEATVNAVYAAIPTEVLDEAVIFMGADSFRTYTLALAAKNLYNYKPEVDGEMTVIMPGTTTKIVGLHGLDGSDKVVGCDPMNLYYGTDMDGDYEKVDFFYDRGAQLFKLVIKFNAGVNHAFGDQIVLGTITA